MNNMQANEKTVIRKQSLEEMKKTYQEMMFRHFPEDEIKPFRFIESAYEKGRYICYGLYDGSGAGECLAYAWMCHMTEENWVLLDYFAVTEKLRGQGVGSWFLKEVLEKYTQGMPVIIEVEDPDRIDVAEGTEEEIEKERQKQLRRISFYLNNGVQETELRASVLNVPYRIMVYLKNCTASWEGVQCDVQELHFDRESLKKAYYSFYSHIEKSVFIGKMHENERL